MSSLMYNWMDKTFSDDTSSKAQQNDSHIYDWMQRFSTAKSLVANKNEKETTTDNDGSK
jgi:hypothetical protein